MGEVGDYGFEAVVGGWVAGRFEGRDAGSVFVPFMGPQVVVVAVEGQPVGLHV